MSKATVYNEQGENIKEIDLNPAVFDVKLKPVVVHEVVVAMQANQRQNLAHTKTRGEVRGGGRKPWRQKGTGRARHGSIRSPLWIGGGVTFGPRNDRNFELKINKKTRRRALCMVLSERARENNIKVLDRFELGEYKTKRMVNLLKNLKIDKKILFVAPHNDQHVIKSAANLPRTQVIEARNLNVLEVLNYDHLVIMEPALAIIEKNLLAKKKDDQEIKISRPAAKVNKKSAVKPTKAAKKKTGNKTAK